MTRWTQEQLDEFSARRVQPQLVLDVMPAAPKPRAPQRAMFALGRLPVGAMNKTEASYDSYLRELTHAGEVIWHKFEAAKLRLADNTFYSPDFMVLPASGFLEMHEVKGFWQDDARAKIKIAAALFPFRFVAVTARAKKHGGGWAREEFSQRGSE
jgi:hypothetical protein